MSVSPCIFIFFLGLSVDLSPHKNQMFSAYDTDHDQSSTNCAKKGKGAWWFGSSCGDANLNGRYKVNSRSDFGWYSFSDKSSSANNDIVYTQMMIRPV